MKVAWYVMSSKNSIDISLKKKKLHTPALADVVITDNSSCHSRYVFFVHVFA